MNAFALSHNYRFYHGILYGFLYNPSGGKSYHLVNHSIFLFNSKHCLVRCFFRPCLTLLCLDLQGHTAGRPTSFRGRCLPLRVNALAAFLHCCFTLLCLPPTVVGMDGTSRLQDPHLSILGHAPGIWQGIYTPLGVRTPAIVLRLRQTPLHCTWSRCSTVQHLTIPTVHLSRCEGWEQPVPDNQPLFNSPRLCS